ncbi:MAG: hypothetical protein ABSC26_05295 [Stellaceae bacterium]|jgi:hypothetical protein
MKRVLRAAALAAGLLQGGPAHAAGFYDGAWTGVVNATGGSCTAGTVVMQIAGNTVAGDVVLVQGTLDVQGHVAADGSVTASYFNPTTGGVSSISGKISDGVFVGVLDTFEPFFPGVGGPCIHIVSAHRS